MSGILHELCTAYAASPDGKVRLDCGCLARPSMFIPCVWHRREFVDELYGAVEADSEECDLGCCDPS